MIDNRLGNFTRIALFARCFSDRRGNDHCHIGAIIAVVGLFGPQNFDSWRVEFW